MSQLHLTMVVLARLQAQHTMVVQQELFLTTQLEHLVQLVQAHQGSWGINVSGSAGSATTAGTVTTAAQPNITSTGTLSSLSVTGTTTTGTLQSATITTGSSSTAGTITGDYTLTSGSTLNATYADLAEKYLGEEDYEPGTVGIIR